jgi:uncharacterized protein (DUF983 family)
MQALWLALRWDIPVFLFISPVTFAWGLSTMKNMRSMLINAALALKKRGASLA